MKTYKVVLTRTYLVSIQAENEELAKRFSEYYLGDCPDLSDARERGEKKFSIKELEMVYNEGTEIIEETGHNGR